MYNLAGQRVDKSYRSIVVKKGRKLLVKWWRRAHRLKRFTYFFHHGLHEWHGFFILHFSCQRTRIRLIRVIRCSYNTFKSWFLQQITRIRRISLFTLHSSLFIWRPAPPLFTSEDNSDKGKTLAQKFYTLLNNRALYDTDQISGFVLPFHCYSEPNGDVVFTKIGELSMIMTQMEILFIVNQK